MFLHHQYEAGCKMPCKTSGQLWEYSAARCLSLQKPPTHSLQFELAASLQTDFESFSEHLFSYVLDWKSNLGIKSNLLCIAMKAELFCRHSEF